MVEEQKDLATTQGMMEVSQVKEAKDDLGFGISDDNKELLIVPRAMLVQGGSPALKDPAAVCKFGDYINSITKQVVGATFIPIAFSTNWIRFNGKTPSDPGFMPELEPGVIIWRATSKNDPAYIDAESVFGPNGEKPLAVQFLNFLSYFPDSDQMMMVSFSKGSFKSGKELFNMVRSQPGMPYAYQYKLGHVTKTGPSGDDYLMMTVTLNGKNVECYDKVNGMAKEFAAKIDRIVPHEEEEDTSFDTEDTSFDTEEM